MRRLTLPLLVFTLVLAACDSGGSAAPPRETVTATSPQPLALVAEVDTLRFDLTTAFRGSPGSALVYALVSGPPGASVVGHTLVVPPQPAGTAVATVRASAGTATAQARIEVLYSLRGPVAKLRDFDPLSLSAGKDSVALDLRTYFQADSPLAFSLAGAPGGVRIDGSTLIVAPTNGGAASVTVTANAPGYVSASSTLALTTDDRWCQPTAPAGRFDPVPFRVGERLLLRYGRGLITRTETVNTFAYRSGGVIWTVLGRRCVRDGLRLDVRQQLQYTETFTDFNAASNAVTRPPVDSTTTFTAVVPVTGSMPPMGVAFGGAIPTARWLPELGSTLTTRTINGMIWSQAGNADAGGLKLFTSSYDIKQTGAGTCCLWADGVTLIRDN